MPANHPCARLDDDRLTIHAAGLTRTWRLGERSLHAIEAHDHVRGVDWAEPNDAPATWRHAALMLPLKRASPTLAVREDDMLGSAAPHQCIDLRLDGEGAALTFRFRVWEDLPLIVQSVLAEGAGDGWTTLDEPELIDHAGWLYRPEADRLDAIRLTEPVASFETVAFRGRTDHCDNVLHHSQGVLFNKETCRVPGHLLHVVRHDGQAGLAAIKLAPAFDEQLNNAAGCDFSLSAGHLSICGSGLATSDVAGGEAIESYPTAIGVTNGTHEHAAGLLRDLMRRLMPLSTPKQGMLVANNWGGGGGVDVVTEAFVEKEIDSAARLGVTHPQIDAGWHAGDARAIGVEQLAPAGTSSISDDFWAPHPQRLPNGLAPLGRRASERGMTLGLWYCLDRAEQYANWRNDLNALLTLWREAEITHFKFDGLSWLTRLEERRVRQLLRELHAASDGAIETTFDITASKSMRPGLLYSWPHVSDTFLENRYTGNSTYYPFRTLRHLWLLAPYLPLDRIQVEFLDCTRRREAYGEHPLAPAAFGTAYSLAVALFARPLAWMHMQSLPDADATAIAAMIKAYRPHQHDIHAGRIVPLGDEPTGHAWTGLASHHPDGHGYLLVFREFHEARAKAIGLDFVPPGSSLALAPITGSGTQTQLDVSASGEATLELPRPASFALYRYEPRQP